MSRPQFDRRICRPREHLVALGQRYPSAWKQVDEMRADRGKGLPAWPEWCFLPLAGAYSIVSAELQVPRLSTAHVGDVARLGALAAWRVTQGIYRFDPDVYTAVIDTPLEREIPSEILYRLPEWCVYLETPGLAWAGAPLHGVWAHLEWDANTGRSELRMLTDSDAGLLPIILHLGPWPLSEAIERAQAEAQRNAAATAGLAALGQKMQGIDVAAVLRPVAEPVLNLLLYLCSQASEIGDGARRPAKPAPKRVRGTWRLFPADKPTTWEVGVRLGAALRRAYQTEQAGQGGGTHAGPRPHIRRAHWHGFRSGAMKREDGTPIPAEQRPYEVRWMPPIPVNVGDVAELPAVVRKVT